jgi:hypothetical protein
VILGIGAYAYSDWEKKKKAKAKSNDGATVEELLDQAAEEGLAVIIWGDIDNCSDWYLTEDWIAEIAQPRFDEYASSMDAQGVDWTEDEAHEMAITHTILDDQLPTNCPVPEGDYFVLQADYPDQPNYYPGSQSTLYLYQDVHNAVLWAADSLATGGEGILYTEA